ncbi:hypothetical protein AA980_01725 [Neobacillus vireti]|nr:hypothetical protein AA980_01725 [Neobacillus vireti]
MSAFWIFPLDVLVWAPDAAAAAFVAAFVAYLHPGSFPLINLSRAKYCTNFIGTLCHANIMVKHGQMGLGITLKPKQILFFLDILR